MKDIELPKPVAHAHSDGEFCWDQEPVRSTWWPISLFTEDQLRAAVEADRAQRVPDAAAERERILGMLTRHNWSPSSIFRYYYPSVTGDWVDLRELRTLLASTPAQPAQQEPDCPRCKGSGEDPEGYFDQSRGPDGGTYDGPCRDCAGTGAAPQPVERKPMVDPCPGCTIGHVCRTPKCGRLALPVDHPLRCTTPGIRE